MIPNTPAALAHGPPVFGYYKTRLTFHTQSVKVPDMGQDKREPDRKPDVEEAITEDQLWRAVAEWLVRSGRVNPGVMMGTLTIHPNRAIFRAWRETLSKGGVS